MRQRNFFFLTVPTVAGWAPDDLTVWAAPFARSFGAVLFALAAFVPHRRLRPCTGASRTVTMVPRSGLRPL